MELTERELLDLIARSLDDDEARRVLGDYWIERRDELRGMYVQLQTRGSRLDLAEYEARLRELAVRAGYAASDLVFDRGTLRWPLSIVAGEPLDEHPELFRMSPLYYREQRQLQADQDFEVFSADVVTPMRTSYSSRERVAIKTARDRDDPVSVALIDRELAILTRIRHPNVVSSLGFAIRRNGRALVTRWGGCGLDRLVQATRVHRRTLGIEIAISVAIQLCDALDAIHRAGIVHRELRPDHVLVGEDGTVTLIDFGHVHAAEPLPPGHDRYVSPQRSPLTYLSPEQAFGLPVDLRTDLFSAILVVCELVEGNHPVREANTFDVIVAIRDCRFSLPAMPQAIAAVIGRALARESEQRYQTAAQLRDAFVRAAAVSSLDIGPHVIARMLCAFGVRA